MEERTYWERRAEEELDCAAEARHPAAVKAHYDLLSLYLDRLYPAIGTAGGERLSAPALVRT